MAEIAGILYGRQATDPDSSTGTTFAEVSLNDRDGSATTITPSDGVEYLVLVYGMLNNPDANTSWTEGRVLFGSTVYGRARSCNPFATFASNDDETGRPFSAAFVITGNGTDEITIETAAEIGGESAYHFGIEVLCIPTSELADFQRSETSNTETAHSTPATLATIGDDLSWSPYADGDYVVITSYELFGDGTESTGDFFSTRVRQGPSASVSDYQEISSYIVGANFTGGQTIESHRFVRLMASLTGGTSYDLSAQLDGTGLTGGGGNISARRIRHYAFRADSVTAVYQATSTSGLNGSPGAGSTDELGGAQLSLTNAGEDVLHSYFANVQTQTATFFTAHFQRDVAVSGGTQVGPNMYRSVTDNGVSSTDDLTVFNMQRSEELAAAAYTIDVQAEWHGSGAATLARNQGDTANASNEVLAIRWQAGNPPPPPPESEVLVQRGVTDIDSAGTTVTLGTELSSLSNAFARITNNRKTSAGLASAAATSHDGNEMSGGVQLSSTTEIDVEAGSTFVTRHAWEVWEYTGPAGGDNEFIVRGRYQLTLTGETTTQTVSGISEIDDCIPFITGLFTSSAADDADSLTAIAWMSGTDTLNISRGSGSNNTVRVWVTVVEFTGANWTCLHGRQQSNADSGAITLRADADGLSGAATSVGDFANTYIHHQFRGNALNGVDDSIADTSAVYEPGSVDSEVDWVFNGNHVDSATGTDQNIHFVHTLENPLMAVTRFSNTNNSAGANNVSITSASLSDIDHAGVEVSRSSSGNGTAYGRGWVNARLTSTTNCELWVHRSGNTIQTRIQVIDFAGVMVVRGGFAASLPLLSMAIAGTVTGGGPDVTGDFAATLPLQDLDASGTVTGNVSGAFAGTLPVQELDASGEVSHTGDFAATLPLQDLDASGTVTGNVSGAFAGTLPVQELDASGEVSHTGDFAATLPLQDLDASGTVTGNVSGAFAGTLPVQELDASGEVSHTGDFAATLPLQDLDASGTVTGNVSGAFAGTLPVQELDASGEVSHTGDFAATLPLQDLDASGTVTGNVSGAFAGTLPVQELDASGEVSHTGDFAATLPLQDLDASGTVTGNVSGAFAGTLPVQELDASGEVSHTGDFAATLPLQDLDASGTVTGNVSGAFAGTLPVQELDASGEVSHTGDFAATLPLQDLDASGTVTGNVSGAFAGTLPVQELDASGEVSHTGDFAATLPLQDLDASGTVTGNVSGAFAGTLPVQELDASGEVSHTGDFAATLPLQDLDASGTVTGNVSGAFAGTLPVQELDASGTVFGNVGGTFAGTLPVQELDASGEVSHTGDFAATLPLQDLDASGQAVTAISGTLALVLPVPIWSSAGSLNGNIGGSFAATLPLQDLDASGTVTGNVSGAFAGTLPVQELDASGEVSHTGDFAATLPLQDLDASGTVTGNVSGAFAGTLPVQELDASGTVFGNVGGTFAGTLPVQELDASGEVSHTGDFAATLPLQDLDAAGATGASGTFSGTLPAPELDAVGEAATAGAFAATLPVQVLDAAGNAISTVSGDFAGTLPLQDLDASGTVTGNVSGAFAGTLPLQELGSAGLITGNLVGSAALLLPVVQLQSTGAASSSIDGTAAWSLPLVSWSADGTSLVTLVADPPLTVTHDPPILLSVSHTTTALTVAHTVRSLKVTHT